MKNLPPKHIAIIMDGNARWAKERKLPLIAGHKKGADVAFLISKCAKELGVEWLTLYTFSTENWKRPKTWINGFMGMLEWYLDNKVDRLMENNVKLYIAGDYAAFPKKIHDKITLILEKTKNNTGLNLVLALNYGGRVDILNAVHKIVEKVKDHDLHINDITETFFAQHLFTDKIPDPDLMIRTSGEHRLSNFLLWQMAYTELAFSEKYWPDFTADDLNEIIKTYQTKERRYGQYLDMQ